MQWKISGFNLRPTRKRRRFVIQINYPEVVPACACLIVCVCSCDCSLQPHLPRRRGSHLRDRDQKTQGGPPPLRLPPQLLSRRGTVGRSRAGEMRYHRKETCCNKINVFKLRQQSILSYILHVHIYYGTTFCKHNSRMIDKKSICSTVK